MHVEIVDVGGENYHPTRMGTDQISIKDDASRIHNIKIHNALYFTSSLVNVISAGKSILSCRDGLTSVDDDTCIKTTFGRSDFTGDYDKHFKTIIHPCSVLQENIINEHQIEQRSNAALSIAKS